MDMENDMVAHTFMKTLCLDDSTTVNGNIIKKTRTILLLCAICSAVHKLLCTSCNGYYFGCFNTVHYSVQYAT